MNLPDMNETLSECLTQYDNGLSGIRQCLFAYEKLCTYLISEIAACPEIDTSAKLFDDLDEIQGRLSAVFWGRGIEVGTKLEQLIREFDRLHEPLIREYWYERFKSGRKWPD